MPVDERYHELNHRAAEAIHAAEQAGKELVDYFSNRPNPRVDIRNTPLVQRMETDFSAVLDGLSHSDPRVRIVALDTVRLIWDNSKSAAAIIRQIALSDPDREVQLIAISNLPNFQEYDEYNAELYRDLAELAISSDDVLIRHSVYLDLCQMSKLYDMGILGVKYVAYPLVFDEELVRQFLSVEVATKPHTL